MDSVNYSVAQQTLDMKLFAFSQKTGKNVFHLTEMRSENFEDVARLVAEELTRTDGSLKLFFSMLSLWATCRSVPRK